MTLPESRNYVRDLLKDYSTDLGIDADDIVVILDDMKSEDYQIENSSTSANINVSCAFSQNQEQLLGIIHIGFSLARVTDDMNLEASAYNLTDKIMWIVRNKMKKFAYNLYIRPPHNPFFHHKYPDICFGGVTFELPVGSSLTSGVQINV